MEHASCHLHDGMPTCANRFQGPLSLRPWPLNRIPCRSSRPFPSCGRPVSRPELPCFRRLPARARRRECRSPCSTSHGSGGRPHRHARAQAGSRPERRRGAWPRTWVRRPAACVGYRIRHETRVGPRTRIEVVTEGVLTRLLQADPALEASGLVIFDEFHERSIHADLGLALDAPVARAILRTDLRLLVMSRDARRRAGGRRCSAARRSSPAKGAVIRSRPAIVPPRPGTRVEAAVAAAVREALADDAGDVLAFLPGAGEIRRAEALLAGAPADVIPLHGSLPQALQDRALGPSLPGRRKVVLATSIAETSLTIDGVRVVVDGGLARVPRYSPRSGMTRLATVRVSRASADQRRGPSRAAGSGRMLSSVERPRRAHLPAAGRARNPRNRSGAARARAGRRRHGRPGRARLARPAAGRGARPGAGAARAARRSRFGGADHAARPSADSLRAAPAPGAHGRPRPRARCGGGRLRAGRAPQRAGRAPPAGWTGGRRPWPPAGRCCAEPSCASDVDLDALRRVRTEARNCRRGRRAWRAAGRRTVLSTGAVLAFAYPDRIGQRRPGEAGATSSATARAPSSTPQALAREEYLVAAELDGQARESRIFLAAPITLEEIETHFANDLVREDVLGWDEAARAVVGRRAAAARGPRASGGSAAGPRSGRGGPRDDGGGSP